MAIMYIRDAGGNFVPVPSVAGKDGEDGYTPVKGVDYFDGKDGVDGKDGYTPVKGVDYFDGKDGADGYTPVKGVDYFDGEDGNDGEPGASGVYIGEAAPSDASVNVWINPSGAADANPSVLSLTSAEIRSICQ